MTVAREGSAERDENPETESRAGTGGTDEEHELYNQEDKKEDTFRCVGGTTGEAHTERGARRNSTEDRTRPGRRDTQTNRNS